MWIIKPGSDFRVRMEIVQGLETYDQVIVNPSDSLTEGTSIQTHLQLASSK